MQTNSVKHAVSRRPRILWIVLLALLFVSLAPMALLQHRVLTLTSDTVIDNEKLQQHEVAGLIAQEVYLYESNLHRQLAGQGKILALSGLIRNVDDPKIAPQVTAVLESFAADNPDVLYVTARGRSLKGAQAGKFRADADPFIGKALQRAFTTSYQGLEFHNSDPLAYPPENRPAFVVAVPLKANTEFAGMLAAVVSLDRVVERLKDLSRAGRDIYLVDREGRIVAHRDPRKFVPGTDVSSAFGVVARLKERPETEIPQTIRFTLEKEGKAVEMLGTYSTVPNLSWAVIVQRDLEDALASARLETLKNYARGFLFAAVVIALGLGYLFAVGITAPIHGLAQATQAISRGEFHERAPVRGPAEVSELAATFNKMADDIGQYVEQLKQAAEENRELFVGSIRMLAAAIDEKDPYTRGHSGRVAKYSTLIGEGLGMSAEELDHLRVSALLHDVGKIGVDDRILKKPGSLTPEEFELMKQHPVKGANIMRPVAQLKEMLPGIELHHEHMDGRGYPYGLKGDQIPLMARIIAVADTLDAMTTNRPYQSAIDLTYALGKIRQLVSTKFDPAVVEALDAAIQSGKLKLSATLVEV